jgi:hypothetical protein
MASSIPSCCCGLTRCEPNFSRVYALKSGISGRGYRGYYAIVAQQCVLLLRFSPEIKVYALRRISI